MPNRRSLSALILTTAMLTGCSASLPEEKNAEATERLSEPVQATEPSPSEPVHPEPEYGTVLGTITMDVEGPDGYMAAVEVTVHEPTYLSSPGQLGPSCVVGLGDPDDDLSVTDATGILIQAMTYKTTLKSHEGFPPPTDFEIPTIEAFGPSGSGGFSENGRCDTGLRGETYLPSQGVEGASIYARWGRATPANPLPSSIEEISFSDSTYELKLENARSCTVHPTDDFSFVGRDVVDSVYDEEQMYWHDGSVEAESSKQYRLNELAERIAKGDNAVYRYNFPDRNSGTCEISFIPAI